GDGEEALLDIDIGRSVLTHGAELDEVRLWCVIAQGKEKVERADDIVDLGHGGVREVDHGEGSAALLGKMDQGLRLDLLHQLGDGASIAQVHRSPPDGPASQSLPEGDPLGHALDRDQALGAAFAIPAPADQAVDSDDVMAGLREVKRRRPAEVTVNPQHYDRLLSQPQTGMLARPD